jgi:hypothetical protein
MAYDQKCYDLAEFFLMEEQFLPTPKDVDELAQLIQTTIEDHINFTFREGKPYHRELYEILKSKGYNYERRTNYKDLPGGSDTEGSFDYYEKDGRIVTFDKGEYIFMTEADGKESPLDIFITETNNIFDPDRKLNGK